jgi:hypothetical protein
VDGFYGIFGAQRWACRIQGNKWLLNTLFGGKMCILAQKLPELLIFYDGK